MEPAQVKSGRIAPETRPMAAPPTPLRPAGAAPVSSSPPSPPDPDELERLSRLQDALAGAVEVPEAGGFHPARGDVVLATDVQYEGEVAHVAGALARWGGGRITTCVGRARATVPYVPGYFCFREGPLLLALVERVRRARSLPDPDLLVVDGHGIAHPRRFGVACWLGLAAALPAVGCAKESLLPWAGELGQARGSSVEVLLDEEVVGHVLRTRDRVKPLYVSPGHRVARGTAARVVLELPGQHRLPDLLRAADHAARTRARGKLPPGWHDLGDLEPARPAWEAPRPGGEP